MKRLIGLLTLLAATTVHSETVQEICHLETPRAMSVETIADTRRAVCGFAASSTDPTVQQHLRDSLAIMQLIAATPVEDQLTSQDPANPSPFDQLQTSLRGALDQLSLSLTMSRGGTPPFTPRTSAAPAPQLTALTQRFGSEEDRWRDPQGYVAALNTALLASPEGRRALECYQRTESERISGRRIEFTPREQSSGQYGAASAAYEVRRDPGATTYTKVVTIDPGPSISSTLAMLAHEYQHACDTSEMVTHMDHMHDFMDEGQRLEQQLAPYAQLPIESYPEAARTALFDFMDRRDLAARDMNRMFMVSELRAYRMTPKVFKDFAAVDPNYFCQQTSTSQLFGLQVLDTGTYMSTLEDMERDGSFVRNLIASYTRLAGYDPSFFYQIDDATGDYRRDGRGQPLFVPDVLAQIQAAGFHAL